MPTFWAYFDVKKKHRTLWRFSAPGFGSKTDTFSKHFDLFKVSSLWIAVSQASFLVTYNVDANFLSLLWRKKHRITDLRWWFWLKNWHSFKAFWSVESLILFVNICFSTFIFSDPQARCQLFEPIWTSKNIDDRDFGMKINFYQLLLIVIRFSSLFSHPTNPTSRQTVWLVNLQICCTGVFLIVC